jgi:hypothetical protein
VTVFRLGVGPRPEDASALAESLKRGFEASLEAGSNPPTVDVRESAWPALESLVVDLTGVGLAAEPGSADGAAGEPGPTVGRVEVDGLPLRIGGTEVTLGLELSEAAFAWPRDGESERWLRLVGHGGGGLNLFVSREELRRRVEAGLSAKLAGQGAKVLSLDLEIETAGENRVGVEIFVTIRMLFKAKVRATAELALAPDLLLVVEKGEVKGENMGGRTVAGLARPQLEKLVGQEFALGSLLPAGLTLDDVRLRTDGGIGVAARIRPE